MNEGEALPVMLHVAFSTCAAADSRMVSSSCISAGFDLRVTHQTFVIGKTLSDGVALSTVLNSFKVGMRSREFSRGELPESDKRKEKEE